MNTQAPRNWREYRRRRAIELLSKGFKSTEIADLLGVTRGAVSQWRKRYLETGSVDTIHNGSGRKPKLTREQLMELGKMLDHGAEYWGYSGQVWTQARVKELIKRKFDVTYALNYVGVLLRACGFSVQRPLRRATQRHEEGIQQWVRQDWPAVKKSS